MLTKTLIALCASVVFVAAFAPAAAAQTNRQQTNAQEWWRTAPQKGETGYIAPKGCVRGEESAASAYPTWMQC